MIDIISIDEQKKIINDFNKKFNISFPPSLDDQDNLQNLFQLASNRDQIINHIPSLVHNLSQLTNKNGYKNLFSPETFNDEAKELLSELDQNVLQALTQDLEDIGEALYKNDYTNTLGAVQKCLSNVLNGLNTCYNNLEKKPSNNIISLKNAIMIGSVLLLLHFSPIIQSTIAIVAIATILFPYKKDNNLPENSFANVINSKNNFEQNWNISNLRNFCENVAGNTPNLISALAGLKLDANNFNQIGANILQNDNIKNFIENIISLDQSMNNQDSYPQSIKNIINKLPNSNELLEEISNINLSNKSSIDKLFSTYSIVSHSVNEFISNNRAVGDIIIQKDLKSNLENLKTELVTKIIDPLKLDRQASMILGLTKEKQSLLSSQINSVLSTNLAL